MWCFHGLSAILVCLLWEFSTADLPIHAVTKDVSGRWILTLGEMTSFPQTCGSLIPNSNRDNLSKDPSTWFSQEQVRQSEIKVTLSDSPIPADEYTRTIGTLPSTRAHWKILPANVTSSVYGETVVASWTMVFDEGWEVIILHRDGTITRLFTFAKYFQVQDDKCKAHHPRDGDGEESDGSTPCYETDSSRTMVGWVSVEGKGRQWGCFIGEKDTPERFHESRATVTRVRPTGDYATYGMHSYRKHSRMIESEKNGVVPSFLEMQSTVGIGNQLNTGLYACSKPADPPGLIDSLPLQFSWGDPFTNSNFTTSGSEGAFNQGSCGSCYSLATSYVLQKRSEILLRKILGDVEDWGALFSDSHRLSPDAAVACSYYTQGCDGGFPYLVGKWATEFGTPSIQCMPHSSADRSCAIPEIMLMSKKAASHSHPRRADRRTGAAKVLSPVMDFLQRDVSEAGSSASCGPENRVYASNYGYVGGCYECCSAASMMQEIYNHGPIVVAIDAPPEMFQYTDGIFDKAPSSHSRVCDEPEKGLNGWEFTTHAQVFVGYGTDPPLVPGGEPRKYWIARNSWGESWGRSGYIKIARGKNQIASEAQAMFVDPDPTRGLLKEVLDRHGVSAGEALARMSARYD